jgi:cysteinyl-tRNA synthetase
MKYLGESFDLHCGAVDLVFPHHENEIAQSEAATDKPFVRYWMHGEHLIVEGEKMSKSKGNFYTLRDLEAKGIAPLAVRYALQSVPYRRQLNFTFDLLHQAGKSLARLQDFKLRLTTEKLKPGSGQKVREVTAAALQDFEKAMDDDLNTAQALAAVFDWVRDLNTELSEGRFCEDDRQTALHALEQFNQVLELWSSDNEEIDEGFGASSSSARRPESRATSPWPTRSATRFMNWVTSSRIRRKASAGRSGREFCTKSRSGMGSMQCSRTSFPAKERHPADSNRGGNQSWIPARAALAGMTQVLSRVCFWAQWKRVSLLALFKDSQLH